MKVRLIRSDKYKEFEKEINSFVKGKKVLDIKYNPILAPLEYTGPSVTRAVIFDSALIMYEEDSHGLD